MKKGKKYIEAAKQVDSTKQYPVEEAVALLKKISFEKFDASVEIAFNLNLDPRKAEQNLRGAFVLPHGTGKTKRVLVFARSGAKADEAKEAGADYVGEDEYVQKIMGGWLAASRRSAYRRRAGYTTGRCRSATSCRARRSGRCLAGRCCSSGGCSAGRVPSSSGSS